MARSAQLKIGGDCMRPRDAWLLEKLDEIRAQSKAAAFGKWFRPKNHEERLSRFKKNSLPTRLEFKQEVVK